MLSRIDIILGADNLNYNMGSLFHGFLMSIVDTDYAEFLHYNTVKPYSTFLFYSKEHHSYIWRINTLNQLSKEQIIDRLLDADLKKIELTHNQLSIDIKEVIVYPTVTYEALYLTSVSQGKIQLKTPCSFKSDSYYQILPKVDALLDGVIRKINTFSETVKLEASEVIADLMDTVFIASYNLKSTHFYLEKTKIKSFIGSMQLKSAKLGANQELLLFILSVAEYTGFGMKTALGMGGIHVE